MTQERLEKEVVWLRAEEIGQRLRQQIGFASVSYPHGEIGKLAFAPWGLVEPQIVDPLSNKKASGLWRVTERGKQFVSGSITIPKYLWIYDNRVDAVSDEQVSIEECFKNKFSYQSLMQSESEENEEIIE